MRAYKVFLIVKAGRNTNRTGLFFETDIEERGMIVQVVDGRDGMRLQRYTDNALDSSWDDRRKDHIGWVMEVKFEKVWNVVRAILPPGRSGAQCKTAREWTDLVMQMLQKQGVMENTRENEATVHEDRGAHGSAEEEEDDDDDEEEEEADPRPSWFNEESEEEISEEE